MRSSFMFDRRLVVLGMAAAAACSSTGSTIVPSAMSPAPARYSNDPNVVEVIPRPADQRVDVLVGGRPFTSYIYPASLKRPVLYPVRAATGTLVTRGYPLEPRPGERVDRPDQAGLWFGYGNVNGVDFWNNSTAMRPEDAAQMGTVVHRSVNGSTSGPGEGTLDVTDEWVNSRGKALLKEDVHYVFRAKTDLRTIDRITTLTALGTPVEFADDKEGMIGIRVARFLEQPSTTPETFTDASGRVSTMAVLDNSGVTGKYRTSEGKEGDAVWGTRGKWATLSGVTGGDTVRIAMFDHPANPGYPTYWHARGYGLFAANPIGQRSMTNGKAPMNFRLGIGQSVIFRHQVLVMTGVVATQEIQPYYDGFTR